jgi:hypothetical protein
VIVARVVAGAVVAAVAAVVADAIVGPVARVGRMMGVAVVAMVAGGIVRPVLRLRHGRHCADRQHARQGQGPLDLRHHDLLVEMGCSV